VSVRRRWHLRASATGRHDAIARHAIALGGNVGRATALTGSKALTGFSAFDQDYAMINTPQSPVPTSASFGQVNFYRLGSNARIRGGMRYGACLG